MDIYWGNWGQRASQPVSLYVGRPVPLFGSKYIKIWRQNSVSQKNVHLFYLLRHNILIWHQVPSKYGCHINLSKIFSPFPVGIFRLLWQDISLCFKIHHIMTGRFIFPNTVLKYYNHWHLTMNFFCPIHHRYVDRFTILQISLFFLPRPLFVS